MSFYVYKNNEQVGPIEDSVIEEGLRTGKFSPIDLASRDGATGWESLSTFFPSISQSRSRPPSPPPPSPLPPSPPLPSSFSPPPPHAWMPDPNTSAAGPGQADAFGKINNVSSAQPGGLFSQPYQPPLVPQQANQFVDNLSSNSSLPMAGMVLGIVTAVLMVVGLVPCLGWVNWLMLTVGAIAVIVAFIGMVTVKNQKARNKAIIGLALAIIALIIGTIRLIISGMIFGGGGCI